MISLADAIQELRVHARGLIQHKPVSVDIIIDLEKTAERLRKHSEHLVEERSQLAGILEDLSSLGQAGPGPGDQETRWRCLAREFHAIQDCILRGILIHDFSPDQLAKLRKRPEFSPGTRGVFAFLLHVWNPANRFDLAETARWDFEHLGAFRRWANGHATGTPCHYF